jgi:RimJ/RimL family protein N-acetyltransferase
MPLIPSFATERLILRPPSPGDLESIVALATDAEVMRFPGQGKTRTPKQAAAWVESMLSDARHGFAVEGSLEGLPGLLTAIERESQAFVGLVTLRLLPGMVIDALGPESCPSPCVELGFILAQTSWNRGFATEASRALITYGFETLGVQEIFAMVDVLNAPSNRVLEKLGFRQIKKFNFNGADHWFLSLPAQAK